MIVKAFIISSVYFTLAFGQKSSENENAINSIFNSLSETNFLDNYEEVAPPKLQDLAALPKCGEGEDENIFVCVPYYNCDPNTNTVKDSGVNGGANVIDIRFSENKKCDHYLDVCCQNSNNSDVTITKATTPTSRALPSVPPNLFTSAPPTVSTTTRRTRNRGTSTSRPEATSRSTRPRPRPKGPVITSSTEFPPDTGELQCGIRNSKGIDFSITGNNNHEAEFGEFPWMVAVLKKNPLDNEKCICGGSIISPVVILTGAHCVRNWSAEDIIVRAGEWDTQTEKERIPYQERNVYRIVIHEGFDPNNLYNDVALLVLDRALSKTDNIGTVCLPNQSQLLNSRNCFATGWGKDIFGQEGRYSVILKKIQLPLVNHNDCQRALRKTRLGNSFVLHKSFTCAGGEAGVDTCTGDGGSPLVCEDPNNPNRYVQAGIVAWGIGCGEFEVPGVYTDVSKFRNWIDKKFRQNNINSSPYIP